MKPKKDDDQATGSSITYGRRYGFAAIVGIAQKDDDANESVKEPEKKQTKKVDNSSKQPTDDRTQVEKWRTWIDGFTVSGATLDMFTEQWEKYLPAIQKLSKEHQAELMISKKEMITFLKEKETKSS
jgi:hypothetical protein